MKQLCFFSSSDERFYVQSYYCNEFGAINQFWKQMVYKNFMKRNQCIENCQARCCNAHGLCPDNFDPKQYGQDYTSCSFLRQDTVDYIGIIVPVVCFLGLAVLIIICVVQARKRRMQQQNNQQEIICIDPANTNNINYIPQSQGQIAPGQGYNNFNPNYNQNYNPNYNYGVPPPINYPNQQPHSATNFQYQNPQNYGGPVQGYQMKQAPFQQPNDDLPPYLQNNK